MKFEIQYLIAAVLVFVITVVSLRIMIPILLSKKMGQKILEIGPRWHKNKEGTPTMGGLSFILATILSFFVFFALIDIDAKSIVIALNILVYALLNAMIGIIDDFAKLRKAKNEGLTPRMKFSFQSVAAILFLISMKFSVGMKTTLFLPFFDISFEVGFFYYIIAYFVLCGIVNSVNLTDGIDGLASSVVLTVGIFFTVVNFLHLKNPIISFFSAVLVFATLGFLVYNFYPAKVFMGDTGSLFLGALVVSMSFLIDNPLLVIAYGGVFVFEAASDILQVAYFKITKGKRLFKMAPLHHHFERCGLTEIQIVILFTLVNAILCVVSWFGMGNL